MSLREKLEMENQEYCMCPKCDMVRHYLEIILDAKSVDEIEYYLSDLFDEAQEMMEDDEENLEDEEFIVEELEGCCGDGITINGDITVNVYMIDKEE